MTTEATAIATTTAAYVTPRKVTRRAHMYRKAASAAGWLERSLTDLAKSCETLDVSEPETDTSADHGGIFIGMPVVEPAPSSTEAMNAWVSMFR